MTKQKLREILASGGLSLLFTPKREPDWQALARDLAEMLGRPSNYHWGMHYPGTPWRLCLCETCESKREVLARYNDAVARHEGTASSADRPSGMRVGPWDHPAR